MSAIDPTTLLPSDLPSSEELCRARLQRLQEAIELQALIRVARARERAAAAAEKARERAEASRRKEVAANG